MLKSEPFILCSWRFFKCRSNLNMLMLTKIDRSSEGKNDQFFNISISKLFAIKKNISNEKKPFLEKWNVVSSILEKNTVDSHQWQFSWTRGSGRRDACGRRRCRPGGRRFELPHRPDYAKFKNIYIYQFQYLSRKNPIGRALRKLNAINDHWFEKDWLIRVNYEGRNQ